MIERRLPRFLKVWSLDVCRSEQLRHSAFAAAASAESCSPAPSVAAAAGALELH
jgi:hypothetical protein